MRLFSIDIRPGVGCSVGHNTLLSHTKVSRKNPCYTFLPFVLGLSGTGLSGTDGISPKANEARCKLLKGVAKRRGQTGYSLVLRNRLP
jgi:hypothetical protein